MRIFLEKVEENALVIHDYNGFNIWVNGEKASTNVAANDDKWHHMVMTWESSTGTWKVYKDGSLVRQSDPAEPFQKGQVSRVITPTREIQQILPTCFFCNK